VLALPAAGRTRVRIELARAQGDAVNVNQKTHRKRTGVVAWFRVQGIDFKQQADGAFVVLIIQVDPRTTAYPRVAGKVFTTFVRIPDQLRDGRDKILFAQMLASVGLRRRAQSRKGIQITEKLLVGRRGVAVVTDRGVEEFLQPRVWDRAVKSLQERVRGAFRTVFRRGSRG
jgi:hypothetical protein